jgi:hypothetical protein
MKLPSIRKLFIIVLISPCFVFGTGLNQFSKISQKQKVNFAGLTKTLVSLLKTRSPANLAIGAFEISIEKLIGDNIMDVFDCDSVINKYISTAGEDATYEMLSNELKNTISERLERDDETLYVNVNSDTISDGLFINYSIYRDRPVSVPIVLIASDTSFSTSFDTTCTAKFEADIDIFLNTKIINSGSDGQGVQIRINKLSFELTSDSDSEEQDAECDTILNNKSEFLKHILKPGKTFLFNVKEKEYSAVVACLSVSAHSYWYLVPANAEDFVIDEGECYTLSYEQLEKGEFKWEEQNISSLKTSLMMIPANEKWDSLTVADNSEVFSYTVDDLFNDKGLEQISLCCDYWIKDGVTARNKKFVLKQ